MPRFFPKKLEPDYVWCIFSAKKNNTERFKATVLFREAVKPNAFTVYRDNGIENSRDASYADFEFKVDEETFKKLKIHEYNDIIKLPDTFEELLKYYQGYDLREDPDDLIENLNTQFRR